jgi:AraC-like DNA-binding protein
VRLRPSGSYVLACLSGEGRIWLEGRWQHVLADTVCMAPPRVLNAFFAVPAARWHFAWLRFEEPPELRPLVGSTSPVLSRVGGIELAHAIQRDPQLLSAWLEVAGQLCTRLSQPWRGQTRLRELWENVEREPAAAWTLPELARRAHMSEEYLRRICLKELGRTPVQHLTYIRMQRAQHLLETTHDKLESVAAETGYDGATVFSKAFKRCIGVTPSDYRSRKGQSAG